MAQVTCPHCRQQLKLTAIAAGKKVRCPNCREIFGPQVLEPEALPDDPDERPARRRPSVREDEAFPVPSKLSAAARRSRRDDDQDDLDERPRRRRRDEEEDDDERPRRRSRRKPGPNSGTVLAVVLGGVFGATALLILAIAAFVSPGFLREAVPAPAPVAAVPVPQIANNLPVELPKVAEAPKPVALGPGVKVDREDPLSLAPADSIFMAGLNLADARKLIDIKQQMQMVRPQFAAQGLPAELADLIENADRVVVAGTIRFNMPVVVVALTTLQPFDQQKVRRILQLGQPEIVRGQSLYRVAKMNPFDPESFVAMPSPKLLVLGVMPRDEFVKCLENRQQAMLPAQLLTRVRQLEKQYLWAALVNDGLIRQALLQARPQDFGMQADLLPVVRNFKTASLALELLPNKDVKVEVAVDCATVNDAQLLRRKLFQVWPLFLEGFKVGVQQQPNGQDLNMFVDDMQRTFKMDQVGTIAAASFRIAEKTWMDRKERQELLAKNPLPRAEPAIEVRDGQVFSPPGAHPVQAVAFTPDGSTLITAQAPNVLGRFDVSQGPMKLQRLVQLEQDVNWQGTSVFSPDGKLLAATSTLPGEIRLFDTSTGQIVGEFHEANAFPFVHPPLAFTPDGKRLISGLKEVKVWDLADKNVVWSQKVIFAPQALAVSPDGKLVAATTRSFTIHVFDAETGKVLADQKVEETELGQVDSLWVLGFSPDGKTLALGGAGGKVRSWDWKAGTGQVVLRKAVGRNVAAAVNLESGLLAVGMGDEKVRILDLARGVERAALATAWPEDSRLAFSPNGKRLAIGMNGGVRLIDITKIALLDPRKVEEAFAERNRPLAMSEGRITLPGVSGHVLHFSQDGSALFGATHDGAVKKWDLATRKIDTARVLQALKKKIDVVALSPDGVHAAIAEKGFPQPPTVKQSEPPGVRIYEIATGKNRLLKADDDARISSANAIAFSADGKLLAACHRDGKVRIWELPDGKLVTTIPMQGRYGIAISPDNKLVAFPTAMGGVEGIALWSLETGQQITLVRQGGDIKSFVMSPDGKFLAVGFVGSQVFIYDMPTLQQRCIFTHKSAEGPSRIQTLAFSADSKLLAMGCDYGAFSVWDVARQKRLSFYQFEDRYGVIGLAFAPQGARLAVSQRGQVELWDTAKLTGAQGPP